MSYTEEADCSMGSMNFESLQLQAQGIKEIQAEHENSDPREEKQDEIEKIGVKLAKIVKLSRSPAPTKVKLAKSVMLSRSPPPAPIKRRRKVGDAKCFSGRKLWEDDEEAEECGMKEIAGFEDVLTRSPTATSD